MRDVTPKANSQPGRPQVLPRPSDDPAVAPAASPDMNKTNPPADTPPASK